MGIHLHIIKKNLTTMSKSRSNVECYFRKTTEIEYNWKDGGCRYNKQPI